MGFGCRWDTIIGWDAPGLAAIRSSRVEKPSFQTSGMFHAQGIDVDGTVLWEQDFHNMTVDVGLTHVLATQLGAGTQITAWFMGLIDNTSFSPSSLLATDTMTTHPNWTENTNYSSGTRPAWTPAAAANKSITNTTSTDFTMSSGGGTIGGAFIVSNSTKGGGTGTLWATGAFATAQVLASGQVLRVTYTCTTSAS